MKATIIKVSMFAGRGYDALKPLIFPVLAQLTPESVELEFLDGRVECLPETLESSDIIALSFDTFSAKRAYYLAKKYKNTSNIIVLGGIHASLLKEEAMQYGDVVMIGDAEDTWPKLIKDIKNGKVKRVYTSSSNFEIPRIDVNHSSFKGKPYLKLGLVQYSRGCRYGCDFCSVKAMYPGGIRKKCLEDVVEEIKSVKEKIIFFIDDNLFVDKEVAISLFNELKPLKKKWACQISIDVALEDKLLRLMKESGCQMVLIGFESLNIKNLKQMNKKANLTIKDYDRAIANIYKNGILIYATFVLGYDEDNIDSFEDVFNFAMKHNFAVANFNPLIPTPGTNLYKRLEDEKRLIYDKWWLDDNYCYGDTAYYPKNLTPEELRDGCKSVRFKFYGMRSILKRLFSGRLHLKPYNLFLFLAINIISNKEIHRKQGRPLGDADEAGFN